MNEVLYSKIVNNYRTYLFRDFNDINLDDDKKAKGDDIDDIFNLEFPQTIYAAPKFDLLLQSNDEDVFLKNYGNPLAKVEHHRVTIKVEYNDGKVVIKAFTYNRIRIAGSKYFRINTYVRYIGFNTKNNTFYSGYINNYHKKRKSVKMVTRNNFYTSPCNSMKIHIKSLLNFDWPELILDSEHYSLYIPDEVFEVFFKKLNIIRNTNSLSDDDLIYKLYLDSNNIKYPNNWKVFRCVYPAPTKKHYKKYKNKFIDTFMGFNKLNGDKLKRILHNVDHIGIYNCLESVMDMFGKDFILSSDDDTIKKIIESDISIGVEQRCHYFNNNSKEKHNAFEIFKLVLNYEINVRSFYDHIRFYKRLKSLEGIKWKSNDYKSFTDEHLIWSDKFNSYDNGNFNRVYSDEFKNELEIPIITNKGDFYPRLLTNTNEYNLESLDQSNCVRTYIKKENSIIISLRKDNIDNKDKATIEYLITYDGEKVVRLTRVQSLGRFNYKLEDDWNDILTVLDSRINDLVRDGKFKLPTAILETNNKKISTKLIPTDDYTIFINNTTERYMRLKWDLDLIRDDKDILFDLLEQLQ